MLKNVRIYLIFFLNSLTFRGEFDGSARRRNELRLEAKLSTTIFLDALFLNFSGVPLAWKDHEKRSGLPQSLATIAVAGSKRSNGSEVICVFLTLHFYANISRFSADKNLILVGMVDKVK